MHSLDAIDRKILAALQSDGRITMQQLADRVGLSVSALSSPRKTSGRARA